MRRMMKEFLFSRLHEMISGNSLEIVVKDYDNYGSGDSSQQDKRTSFRQNGLLVSDNYLT